MRTTILCALTLAAFGCARTASASRWPATFPRVDLPATTSPAPAREAKTGPVYDTQKGFEDGLTPPDAKGGGPMDSDVGAPRWRNNPGSYDDGARPPKTAGPRQNWLEHNDDHVLPPDKFR